jgi:hypothetical protein
MMDFSKASRWRNLVRSIEVATPGPLATGSELKVSFDIMGKVRTVSSEIWAFDTARRLGVRNTESNVTGVFEYTLAPESGGTGVTFTGDVRPHGFMWLLTPLLLKSSRVRYAEQLSNLKKELERSL